MRGPGMLKHSFKTERYDAAHAALLMSFDPMLAAVEHSAMDERTKGIARDDITRAIDACLLVLEAAHVKAWLAAGKEPQ